MEKIFSLDELLDIQTDAESNLDLHHNTWVMTATQMKNDYNHFPKQMVDFC